MYTNVRWGIHRPCCGGANHISVVGNLKTLAFDNVKPSVAAYRTAVDGEDFNKLLVAVHRRSLPYFCLEVLPRNSTSCDASKRRTRSLAPPLYKTMASNLMIDPVLRCSLWELFLEKLRDRCASSYVMPIQHTRESTCNTLPADCSSVTCMCPWSSAFPLTMTHRCLRRATLQNTYSNSPQVHRSTDIASHLCFFECPIADWKHFQGGVALDEPGCRTICISFHQSFFGAGRLSGTQHYA